MTIVEKNPYEKFIDVLDNMAPDTKATYIKHLDFYLKATGHKKGDYNSVIVRPVDALENEILQFLKDNKIKYSHSMITKTYWAVVKFLLANRINANFKYLEMFIPRDESVTDYKAYTHEQIAAFVNTVDLREQLAGMTMATSGARIGALPGLLYPDDFAPLKLDGYEFYAIQPYGRTKDAYWTAISPQASKIFDLYLNLTNKQRKPQYLFQNKHDPRLHVTKDALVTEIYDGLLAAGIKGGEDAKEIQMTNSFRYFFRTALEKAAVTDQNAERLMGRKKERPLKWVYSKPNPEEIIRLTEYTKAIPHLWIACKVAA